MSEYLVTEKVFDHEADTVEGRLADLMERGVVEVDEYKLLEEDVARVVLALRRAAHQ